jgi:hypothetical protein
MEMKHNKHSSRIPGARMIGAFFLLAFLLYGFGRNLFENEAYSDKYAGAILILSNSIVVLLIGIQLRKTLINENMLVANTYLISRFIESLALLSIVLNLVPGVSISMDYGYFVAMLVLGIGSVPMCYTLYKNGLIPMWLGLWGIIGYAVFAFGFLMEFFGQSWSMYLLIPGGLWEVVFAVWLLIKGGEETIVSNEASP